VNERKLIDTHCHLNDREAFPDPRGAIEEAASAGVFGICVVGVDLDSSYLAVELADHWPGVHAIVGHHPNYASSFDERALHVYAQLLDHPKVVALGEIGLDFHWDFATREQQEDCLRPQLELAAERNVPTVFHCRNAYPELLDVLKEFRPLQPVLHCFSGTDLQAKIAVELGCCFGFDGPLTYKKSIETRAIAAWLPEDRILIETDSPWLAPEPYRGKPNRPALLSMVNAALALARGISESESAAMTTRNACRIFGIAP